MWLRITTNGAAIILDKKTLKKPYGWIFFYNFGEGVLTTGNLPIIVDRIDGEIRVTGTAHPLQSYLDAYEATLPVARLQMSLPNEP